MARLIATIEAQILATKNTQTVLNTLNSPSQVAIYRTWIFIQAVTINLFEQLLDVFKSDFETSVEKSFTGSEKWIQDRVFKFQYDATVPQVVQLVDFVPSYPIVDVTKRIITRCSVITSATGIVTVKVAKSEPPTSLSSPELVSLTGYLTQGGDGTVSGAGTGIGFAGIKPVVVSLDSDKLYLDAQIIFDGQYQSVISANTIAAIELYLKNIPFNGMVKVTGLIDAILPEYNNGVLVKGVEGISDVIITDLAMRADVVAFSDKVYLIGSKTEVFASYPTIAGYIVSETTSGQTLADKLTFTAQ